MRIVLVTLVLVLAACDSGDGTPAATSAAESSTTGAVSSKSEDALPAASSTTAPPATTTTTTATSTTAVTTTTVAAGVTVDTYLPSALPRTEVPWGDVGEGWYVALFDSSKADPADESEVRDGPVVLYLVDGDGTRYEVAAWTDGAYRPWQLSDAQGTSALVAGTTPGVDEQQWQMVDMTTGTTTAIHAAGFPEYTYSAGPAVAMTRPTGANAVVHQSDGVDEWLERRSPAGALLATVYTQPSTDEQSSLLWMYGYDGTSLLVAHHGGVAMVSNAGGLLAELWVPPDRRCEPVRWWDSDTFLAACYGQGPASAPPDEFGNPHTYYGQLWLLETDGTAGFAVTADPADPVFVVDFGYRDASPSGRTPTCNGRATVAPQRSTCCSLTGRGRLYRSQSPLRSSPTRSPWSTSSTGS